MGSTFVRLDSSRTDNKKLFGSDASAPIWLQFVPGVVGQVITGADSLGFKMPGAGKSSLRRINSILAKPHVGNKLKRTALLDEEDRYYPLFRGMVDVPMVGDPVLLCTIGGIQYYMGPLNTGNVPGYNPDNLSSGEISSKFETDTDLTGIRTGDKIGVSPNWKDTKRPRLEKKSNIKLDDPENERKQFSTPSNTEKVLGDIHGDMIFEGRHGNSIRIGSRHINPYIFISNSNIGTKETPSFGSFIGMFDRGSIHEHFGEEINIGKGFILGSDDPTIENSKRPIGAMYDYTYGTTSDYLGNKNQILQTSDRITINARTDSIFISAIKNVVIGTGENFTLKSKNICTIDANNVFIGPGTAAHEPMVLGYKLVEVLGDMNKAIGQLQVSATIGGVSAPVIAGGSPGWVELDSVVKNKLTDVLSEFHFIEDNETEK